MKKKFLAIIVLGFAGIMHFGTTVNAASDLPEGFVAQEFAEGFERPTALAPLPDGRMLVAQKTGEIFIVQADGTTISNPLIDLGDAVNAAEDRGLIGIVVDPDFASNHFIYIAYTHEPDPTEPGGYYLDDTKEGCADVGDNWSRVECYSIPKKNARVVRYTEVDGLATNPLTILGSQGGTAEFPSCASYPGDDCVASDSGSHSIGGLRFGPDGNLYVSTGDGAGFFFPEQHAFRAQDLDHLSGKVLRIKSNGEGLEDNPYFTGDVSDNRSKVWAYGFRNPYRFNFSPQGNLLVADVGWGAYEELNIISPDSPGKNYGWPCREGRTETGGYNFMPGCQIEGDYTNPIYDYVHEKVPEIGGENLIGAITGGAFALSDTYPDSVRGSYIFGDAIFGFMRQIRFDDNEYIRDVRDFASEVPFAVEYVTGADGLIYYIEHYSGLVKRLVYTEAPVADFSLSVDQGTAPLSVDFDAELSSVFGGAPLSYAWDFGDGSVGSGKEVSHTYPGPGQYEAQLTVTAQGLTNVTSRTILVEEPFSGGYDADPTHRITEITSAQPYFFGNDIHTVNTFGNDGQNDPVTLHFQIHDQSSGTHLSEYDFTVENQVIEQGVQRVFDASFQLPLGSYVLNIAVTSPDQTVDYLWVPRAATFEVVSRSPVTEDPEIEIVEEDPVIIPQAAGSTTVHRFYSSVYKGHFYTTSNSEKENLESNADWAYEGIAYTLTDEKTAQGVPVYRFYSQLFKGHFYTISETERARTEVDPNWSYEGVAYKVLGDANGSASPIYRFWSPVFKHHFFTKSLKERDHIRLTDTNWIYEGIAWYVE